VTSRRPTGRGVKLPSDRFESSIAKRIVHALLLAAEMPRASCGESVVWYLSICASVISRKFLAFARASENFGTVESAARIQRFVDL